MQAVFLLVNLAFTVLNCYYYLYKRILKLENKNFHLMMFCLIQLSFTFEMVFICLFITQLITTESYYVPIYGTFAVSWMI